MSESNPKLIPCTLLCGFLGAGKTTLLKHILEAQHGKKIAVIVNDMAVVGVDAGLVKNAENATTVEMANGCICCTLREEFVHEVINIVKSGEFECLVVESTGIGEPMSIAEAFFAPLESEKFKGVAMLSEIVRLDTLVTVVDAANFLKFMSSGENLKEIYTDVTDEDDRGISQLFVDQVEFCNTILINKTDLVDTETIEKVEKIVASLNPRAKMIRTVKSNVSLDEIINTGRFDVQSMSDTFENWMKDVQEHGLSGKRSEVVEYSMYSFIYKRERPFHAERLDEFMRDDKSKPILDRILRSKGDCWIAVRTGTRFLWSSAGTLFEIGPNGQWPSVGPQVVYPEAEGPLETYVKDWNAHPFVGDRRQLIVMIGINILDHREEIEKALDACLVTEAEFNEGPRKWATQVDSFKVDDDEGKGEGHGHSHDHDHSTCKDHDHSHDHDEQDEGEEGAGEVLDRGVELLHNGECDAALDAFLHVKQTLEYNLGCCHARMNNAELAMKSLASAIEYGFDDLDCIKEDTDLDSLRDRDDFRAVVKGLEDSRRPAKRAKRK